MNSATFIVKSRTFHGRRETYSRPAFGGSSGKALWSSWRTISKHATLLEAQTAERALPPFGCGERAIFNGGKRVTK